MAFSDLVNELPQIRQASDKLRRAANIIAFIDAGVLELKDSDGDPDKKVTVTKAQMQNLFGPRLQDAQQFIADAKTLVAALVSS